MGQTARVREAERARCRRDQRGAGPGRERTAARGRPEQPAEVDAVDHLGCCESLVARNTELVEPGDARVLERAVDPCGLGEKSGAIRIGHQLVMESLDGELPLEPRHAVHPSMEHLTRGSGAERFGEVVPAEPATRGPRALSSHSSDGSRQYATLSMNSA